MRKEGQTKSNTKS